ncbi:uncharacterized protein B0P05DRAFT_476357, partial [Gilbertella persicaria]|uniref:uncharacterized protein n=1 Tax=Gilbertella persicaria TaxID=101096 RepID=UPI00221E7030
LVILSSEKKPFEFEKNTTVDLPLDSITIHNTIDLQYPIRQITISSLSTLEFKIFAIRTTSTIHLFTLDSQQAIKQIHTIHLAQKTEIKPSIDYSMPIHVEMSPFREYQYVFITNNGYTAIVDGLEDKFLYEDVDDISDNLSYCSRWRSCAFGRSPFTILVASPECIQEKEFTVKYTYQPYIFN